MVTRRDVVGSTLLMASTAAAGAAGNAQDTSTPTAPALEFCFEAQVSIDKMMIIGPSSHGLRRIIPILGGTVKGPKLNGRVLPGGADWQYVRPDDVISLEARYTLQSDDGVLIMVTNAGLRHGPADVIAKLGRGEPVPRESYYFRTMASFEAPNDSGYAWMNKALFVGDAERRADAAIVRFFRVI